MSGSIYENVGHLGCNSCGRVITFNNRKENLVWVLCKDCRYVYSQISSSISNTSNNPGARYERKSLYDLNVPDSESKPLIKEQFLSSGEKKPAFENSYHLFDKNNSYYLIDGNIASLREKQLSLKFNSPAYSHLRSMLYSSDTDSNV